MLVDNLSNLLSPFDVGCILNFPSSKVVRMAKKGTLPRIEIEGELRFDAKDVAEFVRGRRIAGQESQPTAR